jgi:hypothetical protein
MGLELYILCRTARNMAASYADIKGVYKGSDSLMKIRAIITNIHGVFCKPKMLFRSIIICLDHILESLQVMFLITRQHNGSIDLVGVR